MNPQNSEAYADAQELREQVGEATVLHEPAADDNVFARVFGADVPNGSSLACEFKRSTRPGKSSSPIFC